jgi:hypothetical protein
MLSFFPGEVFRVNGLQQQSLMKQSLAPIPLMRPSLPQESLLQTTVLAHRAAN